MKKKYEKPQIEKIEIVMTEIISGSFTAPKRGDDYEEMDAGAKGRNDFWR
jgi:hypothetical protein